MNVKTFFIAAILSLASFPLCAQAESTISSEEQLGYETGTQVIYKIIGEQNEIDRRYKERRRQIINDQIRMHELDINQIERENDDLRRQRSDEIAKENPDFKRISELSQEILSNNNKIKRIENSIKSLKRDLRDLL